MNHLKNEKSPYLKQHVNNPVDWYPWGVDAFSKAKAENKPIFLSIGYSTCHWCHVMEHESFEDDAVAKLLNDNFVSIKVDREERPDIDSVFMMVCQMMTGQGGWPLSIFLTPDQKPFFAGTYFPKNSKYGRVGMVDILPRIQNIWATQKTELAQTVDGIQAALNASQIKSTTNPNFDLQTLVDQTKEELSGMFDSENGGFGTKPKFPSPQKLIFLLENYRLTNDKESLDMAEKTLYKMHQGGFYDHVGDGFHRYSTDEKWILPHFEKMLYDQAWLSYAYTFCYELTKNPFYKKIAQNTYDFVTREMMSPTGGFYSAFDADSEGEEGKFYIWTVNELEKELSAEELTFLREDFEFSFEGNYYDEATQQKNNHNIFYLENSLQSFDEEKTQKFFEKFDPIKQKLLEIRSRRPKPLRDEKILTDWNSIMAASFLKAAKVFKDDKNLSKRYQSIGLKNIDFILEELKLTNHLFHRICDEELQKYEFLDDHASFIWSLTHAYELTVDKKYIQIASEHVQKVETEFKDPNGGYFLTPKSQEVVLLRMRDLYDGAQPSGNSIYMNCLTKLTLYLKDPSLQEKYEQNMEKLFDQVAYSPSANTFLTLSCLFYLHPFCEEGLC
jgi:uncharacterized protein YyaL (SSP411 family)